MVEPDPRSTPLVKGIGRDIAWSYVPTVVGGAFSLLIAGYALRRAGTADYGLFAIMVAITALLTLVEHTLATSVVRATARQDTAPDQEERADARADVVAAHAALLVMALVVAVVSLPLAYLLPAVIEIPPTREDAAFAATLLVAASATLSLAGASFSATALGCRRFRVAALATLAGLVAKLVTVLVLVADLGLVALALSQLVGVAVERGRVMVWVARNVRWFRFRPSIADLRSVRRVLSFGLPLLVLSVDTQIVAASDAIVIGALVGASGAAIYAVGSRIPRYALQMLMQASSVAFPGLSTTRKSEEKLVLMRFMTRTISYAGGLVLTLIAVFRQDLVELVLGRPSPAAETVLLLLCLTFIVDVCLQGPVLFLIANGRHGVMAKLVPAELAMNLPLTVLFVGIFGVQGAAGAGLVTFMVMDLVLFPRAARGEFPVPVLNLIASDGLLPAALGAGLALVGSSGALLLAPSSPLRVAIGGLASGLLAVAVGLLALGPSGRRSLHLAVQR